MLLKIVEAKEREEARRFANHKQAMHEKKIKLTELEGYLGEYNERFSELTRFGTQAGQIRSSYAFISQLNTAIAQQQKAVSDSERSVEEYRQHWLDAKRRVDILQMTVDKMLREELEKDNRHEQLIADEAARRKYRQP